MNAAKKRLYELVDSLPEQQVPAAERLLQSLQGQPAGEESEPVPTGLTTADEDALLEGLDELDRGEGVPAERVYAELRAKYDLPQ